MQIYGTKVNHLTNPLGFRMDRTVFSWKVKECKGNAAECGENPDCFRYGNAGNLI